MLVSRLRNRAGLKLAFWQDYARERFASNDDTKAFDYVETCCLFIGHPRSGSTLIGALLDAHPDVAIATELDALRFVELGTNRKHLYQAMLKKADTFVHKLDYCWEGYRFEVPNQYQGKTTSPLVIGDKKAGVTARRLRDRPELLEKLKGLIGDDVLKIVQVVRNPFDNITTRWRRGRFAVMKKPFAPVIEEYFSFYESAMRAKAGVGEENFLAVYHEDVIEAPEREVERMCRFLGLQMAPDYLKDCASLIKPSAHQARFDVSWSQSDIAAVEAEISRFPALARYRHTEAAKSPLKNALRR